MTPEARLRHYAGIFDVVEVNASYYAIPDARAVLRWLERTPPGFVFHVKAYALLTGHHPRPQSLPADLVRLLPQNVRRTKRGEVDATAFPPSALDEAFRLFRAALAPLAESGKLGYVLFQLAPWVRYEHRWLDYLQALPERLPGWSLAVEFRDRSWLPEHTEEVLTVLRRARLANVVVDGPPTVNAVPRARRRHGPHRGAAVARPQRGGLASPAPWRGADRAGEVRLPVHRGGARRTCSPRSKRWPGRPSRCSCRSTTTTVITRCATR